MNQQKYSNRKNRNSLHVTLMFIVGVLFILSLISPSCKDQTTNNGTSNIVFPDSNISFTKHVEPLFIQTCIGCHNSTQALASLDLETDMWHALRDHQPQIVIPGQGSISPLVLCLEGKGGLPQMPPKQPLTTNQINGVKKWIDEGAQYN